MRRENGVLVVWSDQKKYGYIRPSDGGKNVFLHAKDLHPDQRAPRLNDQVTYILEFGETSNPSAKDARLSTFAWPFAVLLIAGVTPFIGLYVCAVWRNFIPFYPVIIAYFCMSLVTVIVCHHDTCAAQTGAWRVSDKDLHFLEFIGGWPGSLLSQIFFRHKLKKFSYQAVFSAIVLVHCTAWAILSSSTLSRKLISRIPDKPSLENRIAQIAPSIKAQVANIPKTLLAQSAAFSTNPAAPAVSLPKAPQAGQPAATPPPNAPLPVLQPATVVAQSGLPAAKAPKAAQLRPETTLQAVQAGAFTHPLEDVWTNAVPDDPLPRDPAVRRSLATVPDSIRHLAGTVRAVSASNGILVALPPEFDADGVIPPATLVPDFHRRFQFGEQITVVVHAINMKGRQKQIDLRLVNP